MEISRYFIGLVRWWWLIALSMIVAGASSFLATRATPPAYSSRVTLMVGQSVLQNPNPSQADLYTGQVLAQSYADLVLREPVMRGTLQALGLDWDWEALRGITYSRMVPGTQLLEIAVTDSDPQRARALVDEIAYQLIQQSPAKTDPEKEAEQQFMLNQIEVLKANLKKAQDEMQQLETTVSNATSARQIQDARARQAALQSQISTWQSTYAQLYSNLQRGSPNTLSIVEPAQLPAYPMSPNMASNVGMAAAVGLVLAVAAALFLEFLDDTIKTPEDVRQSLRLSTLGNIEFIHGAAYSKKLVVVRDPQSDLAEAYRALRTNLQYAAIDGPLQILMVASSAPREGKSLTSANLAAVLAQAGNRVVLVDADLRRPVLHQVFETDNRLGLTTLLMNDQITVDQVVQPTPVPNLKLMATGPLPPNPSELLGSKRMTEILHMLRQYADIAVFDTSPIGAVTDAVILGARADGTLMVVQSGRTRRKAARECVDELQAVGAPLLGVCLNRMPRRRSRYYYSYRAPQSKRRRGGNREDGSGPGITPEPVKRKPAAKDAG